MTIPSDDEAEAQNLISSLRKLFEKKKSIKSLEKTLTTILDRIEKIVRPIDTPSDVQQHAIVLCKVFDEEFTNLASVATSHV